MFKSYAIILLLEQGNESVEAQSELKAFTPFLACLKLQAPLSFTPEPTELIYKHIPSAMKQRPLFFKIVEYILLAILKIKWKLICCL